MRKLVQEKENELRKAADEVELRNLAKNQQKLKIKQINL